MQVLSFNSFFKSSKSNFYFGLVATLILGGGLFLSFIQPGYIDTDAGIFSAVAFKNLENGGLYIYTWENKPPALIYLIQALFFVFSNKVYVLFYLALLGILGISVGLYFLFYKYFQSLFITVIFTAFALSVIIQNQFVGDGLYTEIFGTLCLVLALVFYEYQTSNKHYFIASILLGLSFWFKEPFLLPALVILVLFFYKIKHNSLRFKLLLSFGIPSLFFILCLLINGSLTAFLETVIYNFSYIGDEAKATIKEKYIVLRNNLFAPVFSICMVFILLFYTILIKKIAQIEVLFFILILVACAGIFLISPHSFGHYYFAFVVLFFIVFAKLYTLYKQAVKVINPLFIGIVMYLSYNSINEYLQPKFIYKITTYQPDNIAKRLLAEPNKTLFIDYVTKAEYFIKGNKIHTTFMPVPVPVHFQENKKGIENRQRIWKELNSPKPDFLITTFTSSYFYWFVPDDHFYYNNYEKIDSINKKDENVVYLWQLKK